ncbi:MAG: DEAD/DEAH box helicase family protein [Candidatus Heimdallarchaeaceae archaeon]
MNLKTSELFGLSKLELKTEYNTDENDIINELYKPCLEKAISYDRAVGYFRANIYRELGESLLDFSIKGGKTRIVCSPDIPEKDEKAARKGYKERGKKDKDTYLISLLKTFEIMADNPEDRDCLEMLRLLIETDRLDLYVALRPGGIYHRKIGKFEDEFGNKVVFSGSGNETRQALVSIEDWVNDEDFDVYRSWGEAFEVEKLERKELHLTNLFTGKSGRTEVRPINKIEREYLKKFRKYKSLEECRQGAKKRQYNNKPIAISPYPYQIEAIEAWKKSNLIGMLSMATGTGKTFTALFAVQELVKKGYPILIVVPTTILINQWIENITIIYQNIPILVAGGGYDWRNNKYKRMFISKIPKPRIILSTMNTASSNDFLEFVKQAENLVLIADEAHRLGSKNNQKILNLNYYARLGLSATPERQYDSEGNHALQEAFGINPVYHLPIDAEIEIEKGKKIPILGNFLSNYNFYFYTINLMYEEQKEWNEITEELRTKYAILNNNNNSNKYIDLEENIKQLLIRRARIIKKAKNKESIISKIIDELYPTDGNWIIYCEDEEQLNSVLTNIQNKFKHIVFLKYHSKMSEQEKSSVKNYFEHNPSIIVSIRCLDEGVDIPKSNGAIILASSKNPRQYIQRRGRVLRRFKGKRYSDIVDVIVEPNETEEDIEHSIIKSEISRAWKFAQNAQNRDILHDLWRLCLIHKIDISLDAELSFNIDDDDGEQ